MSGSFEPAPSPELDPTGGHPPRDAQIEALTLTVAHLAAQLTMTQLRLRALASALERAKAVSAMEVRKLVLEYADREAGFYLRENLGPDLSELVETETLAREIVEFLGGES